MREETETREKAKVEAEEVADVFYHWVEGLAWPDALLDAAMLLDEMGPVDPLRTVLQRFHLEADDEERAGAALTG